MKKTILVILAVAACASAAGIVWNAADSATNTNWSNNGNWVGGAAPGTTDTAIFDGTGGTKAPTIAGAISVAGIRIASTYTRTFSDAGYALTLGAGGLNIAAGGRVSLTGAHTTTGTVTIGRGAGSDTLILTNGSLSINADVSFTITWPRLAIRGQTHDSNWQVYWSLYHHGTGNVTQSTDNSYLGFDSTWAGDSGKTVTFNGTREWHTEGLGVGKGTVSIGVTRLAVWKYGDAALTLTSGHTLSGTGALEIVKSFAGTNTIPAINATVSVQLVHRYAADDTTKLTANIKASTVDVSNEGITCNPVFSSANYEMDGALSLGNSGIGTLTINLGSSVISKTNAVSSLYSTGGATKLIQINRGSSTLRIRSAYSLNAYTSVNAGTSVDSFVIASNSLVTLNGNSIYDLVVNKSTVSATLIPQDTLRCRSFLLKTGRLNTNGKTIIVSGNFTVANTCTDTTIAMTALHSWIFTGASPTLTLQGTAAAGARRLDSAQWVPQHSLYIVMDSNNTIKSFSPVRDTAPQVWTMQASRTLTVLAAADSSWSGTATRYDTLRSSTPGGAATIAISAVKRDAYLYVKDITLTGYTDTCLTCIDGGGNTGWVFGASCSTTTLIRAPTQTAVVGVAITPMVHAWTGATPDSIRVRTALPAGLSAHPATGTISGTPTDTSSMTAYLVVGYACSDSSRIYDSLRVRGVIPVLSTLKHPMGRTGYADTCLGSGFGTSGGTASLGGTSVTITKQVDDTLIWTVPTKAKGTYNWIYTAPFGEKDTVSFRVLVPSIIVTNP